MTQSKKDITAPQASSKDDAAPPSQTGESRSSRLTSEADAVKRSVSAESASADKAASTQRKPSKPSPKSQAETSASIANVAENIQDKHGKAADDKVYESIEDTKRKRSQDPDPSGDPPRKSARTENDARDADGVYTEGSLVRLAEQEQFDKITRILSEPQRDALDDDLTGLIEHLSNPEATLRMKTQPRLMPNLCKAILKAISGTSSKGLRKFSNDEIVALVESFLAAVRPPEPEEEMNEATKKKWKDLQDKLLSRLEKLGVELVRPVSDVQTMMEVLGWKFSNPVYRTTGFHQTLNLNSFDERPVPFTGLDNLGATCYMNAVLQALFANRAFRSLILNWVPDRDSNTRQAQLWRLFTGMQLAVYAFDKTKPFFEDFKVNGKLVDTKEHKDADEMRMVLLQMIKEEAHKEERIEELDRIFECTQSRQIECSSCHRVSPQSNDSFNVIRCPTETKDPVDEDDPPQPETYSRVASLEESLGTLFYQGALRSPPKQKCNTCKAERSAKDWERTALSKLPQELTFAIQRFEANGQKSHAHFSFPRTIDMARWTVSPETAACYELSAVISHRGAETGGHYWTHAVDQRRRWFKIDDEDVSDPKEDDLERQWFGGDYSHDDGCAYMLFYCRVN